MVHGLLTLFFDEFIVNRVRVKEKVLLSLAKRQVIKGVFLTTSCPQLLPSVNPRLRRLPFVV